MKNFNKNVIVFIFCSVFILCGFSKAFVGSTFYSLKEMFLRSDKNPISAFTTFKSKIDKNSSETLLYHDQLMDLNSILMNVEGKTLIKKDDYLIAKTFPENLIELKNMQSNSEIEEMVSKVSELQKVSEENGAKFLYCMAPTKQQYATIPSYITDYSTSNFDRLYNELIKNNIPVLNFTNMINNSHLRKDELYFYTDHHWKPQVGFLANADICKALNSIYDFEYNADFIDINNYNIETYDNLFLGSIGKKVGTYFSWQGADDFDLITPKFETNLTEEQPFKNEIRTGQFENTALFLEHLEKNYYERNPYATYCGGDFRLQIIKNNLNANGKKILIIRDSYACVVAPFLALQTAELHICDMRNYGNYVGEKLNMKEYIPKFHPDYVIVLYSNPSISSGRFDFFE